jgi:hypothetical protein
MENQTNSNVNQTKRIFIFVVKHKTSNNSVKKKTSMAEEQSEWCIRAVPTVINDRLDLHLREQKT